MSKQLTHDGGIVFVRDQPLGVAQRKKALMGNEVCTPYGGVQCLADIDHKVTGCKPTNVASPVIVIS